jgi:two-component system, chemotaxis family, sensor kinase CheA
MGDFSEYKDLYIQSSRENIQHLNASLLTLEKNPTDVTAIEEVFRYAHTLKGEAAAMEYQNTGYLCHTVEDVFYEIKNGRMQLTPELADHLFTAFDALTDSINHIEKEDHETDLSAQIEALKQLTGVTTEGIGKSTHAEAPPAKAAPAPPAQPTPPAEAPAAESEKQPAAAATANLSTIPVKVEVLDEMMSLLENLLIERLKLKNISDSLEEEHQDLKDYFNSSEKLLASLQYQITKARAVPVSLVFDHFPRAVRDLARTENKEIELVVTGGDLELDRTIVDRLDEPLIHLLRNAVSHGIQGKGTITLSAERQKDYAQIGVADNGQGINWEQVAKKAGLAPGETNPKTLKDALFSGISTSENVTQISGRGVGLMAIKRMVDNFGGAIDIISEPGKGTHFIIKLPLTLAIAKALFVTVNQRHFAIPTLSIERIVAIAPHSVKKMAEQEIFVLEDNDIPLLRLDSKLAPLGIAPTPTAATQPKEVIAVIVGDGNGRVGLIVDSVVDTTDIVIKPVPEVLRGITGFSGVTILSNGTTALIINPQELY